MVDHPIRILFVCTGNICRSPLAQAVLQRKLIDRGIQTDFLIDSCGTAADHLGQQADTRMRRVARSHGVMIDHRARRIVAGDITGCDLIIGMDEGHMRTLTSLARQLPEPGELRKLLWYVSGSAEGAAPDVPDPWYGGQEGFERVFDLVDAGCEALAERLAVMREG
ncbi:MAG: low molecular weight phosphotyrosine protein phosphatase [Spirochaetales bacterium]|nr:MAG: low molecular weight phosphotyrosine protein phosphatase [Spirochaetales bacterium]